MKMITNFTCPSCGSNSFYVGTEYMASGNKAYTLRCANCTGKSGEGTYVRNVSEPVYQMLQRDGRIVVPVFNRGQFGAGVQQSMGAAQQGTTSAAPFDPNSPPAFKASAQTPCVVCEMHRSFAVPQTSYSVAVQDKAMLCFDTNTGQLMFKLNIKYCPICGKEL